MNKTQTYANALYDRMLQNAETRVVGGRKIDVWTGSITKTCRQLGIPKGTDRRLVAPLEDMECIAFLQKGTSMYPSTVVLLKAPTEESWDARAQGLTSRPSVARLSREVEEIKTTLGGVNLAEALLEIHRRLTELESRVAEKS